MTVFAHTQTTNKLVNEAANDSARVSGQDRKIPPALGTNQIAGFGGFRPLTSLEKNKKNSYLTCDVKHWFETEAKPTNFRRIFDFYTVTEHPDTLPVLLGELGIVVSIECWALVDIN